MKWEDVGSIVGKFAPLVGSAFGPAGTAVGTLVSAALGVENTPSAVAKEIRANPEAAMKIVEMQERNKGELERLLITSEIEHHKLDNASFDSARARSTKLAVEGYHNYRADVMILLAFLSFCFIAWLIQSTPTMERAVLSIYNMAIGYLLKMIGDAFQFEFGSSRGSKLKDIQNGR